MSVSCNEDAGRKLAQSVAFLCKKHSFSFAQLDDTFRAVWRHGDLADWITPGRNVCTSTELFFGMEREFLNLQDEDGACLVLSRVGLPQTEGVETAKISVEVFWDDAAGSYHIVIHRLTGESEVELELLRQIRARRLAEQHAQTARAELAEQQTLLNVLMEEAPVALALFDTDRRYLFATRRWVKDFHLECQPVIGRGHDEVMPELSGDGRQKYEACLAGAALAAEVTALGGAEGASRRWVRWTHRPWQRMGGVRGGVLTAAEDLTSAIEARCELEVSNQQLRLVNRRLEQFSAIVTHDFNAPLRSMEAVIGDLAALSGHEQAAPAAVTSLHQHVARMKTILGGLSEYCGAGHRGSQTARVNIAQLVAEIGATLPRSSAYSIQVHADIPEIEVQAAPFDLVLRNLIGNAIKHHDRKAGQITVSLSEKGNTWLLEVADDGPGIPSAHHAAIFEPFTCLDSTDSEGGHGMGLAIVKRALDGTGATIEVKSSAPERRGCVFVLSWPKPQFFHKEYP